MVRSLFVALVMAAGGVAHAQDVGVEQVHVATSGSDSVVRALAQGEEGARGTRPTRPVTGQEAWSDHELKLHRGWVAVEQEVDLRALDMQALAAREQIERGDEASGPELGPDGSIEFVYGEAVPTIFCQPLTITDIALQEGEQVVNYTTGTGRGGAWHVGVAVNPVDREVRTREPHIVVRPKRHTAEKTTLTVWTDRRAYHFDLVLSETPFRFVSFRYLEDEKVAALAAAAPRAGSDERSAGPSEEPAGPFSPRPWEWHRNYESECVSRFWRCRRIKWMKPESVSDDGNITEITLPAEALSQPRPVFHVMSPTGDRVQVNYSLHGRTYVIPQVFDEGSLILRYGKRRRHVLEVRIRRVKED